MEEIVMALQEMVRASNDETVRQILEMRSKARHEEASRLYQAKREGIEEGIEKRNIEVAKNMLNLKLSLEVISQTTGLSIGEIEKLK
ncbi:MAG TPA: hypothetical protein PL101_12795 [Bacteroidales bacterium]|nr:hypothetical protein [Bacteroidales bacterium]